MDETRLGDIIDDYCIKCRRMTNHAVVSIVEEQVAKVRCRSCYHDHTYLHEQIPPSKKDLKKLELANAALASGEAPAEDADEAESPDAPLEVLPDDPPEVASEVGAAADEPKKPAVRGRAKKA
jgi:hypothetical protein